MKLRNIKQEFELITKLLNSVNSKEEFDYLVKRRRQLLLFTFSYCLDKVVRRLK